MDCKTFVRPTFQWVGGKNRLLKLLIEHLPTDYKKFHEVFLGGGSLLFSLSPDNANCYEMNDILCNLYDIIRISPEELIKRLSEIEKEYLAIDNIDERKEYYYDIRNKFNEYLLNPDKCTKSGSVDNMNKAVYFKFLNKICFNAVYRVNSKGGFNVPFGNGKNHTICDTENIMNMSKYFNEKNIKITNGDFSESLKFIRKGDFVYIDPPYYPLKDTSFTSYTKDGFGKSDHNRLIGFCKAIHKKGGKFMLSNSNCDFIKDAFKEEDYNITEVSISRSLNSDASKRGKTKCELLVTNY